MDYVKNAKKMSDDQSLVDKTEEVVGFINSCWLTILSETFPKEQVGLKYISHMYDDNPYWYLWFSDCAGVYKCELLEARMVEGYDWLAEFAVKYYPRDTEAVYNGLSILEKACRAGNVFNTHPPDGPHGCQCHSLPDEHEDERFSEFSHDTGAPSYQFSNTIPEDFFYAGNMSVAFKKDIGTLVRVKSQTTWRVIFTEDYAIPNDNGAPLIMVKKGEVDRDYPGFMITRFLYNKFVRCWALFNKYTTQDEHTWKGEGMLFKSDGQNLWPESSPDIQKIIAQTALRSRPEDVLPSPADEDIVCMDSKIH
jgi:hypothetical protein